MKKLVKLSLKKNKIVDLKGIENFPNLNYLKLSRNNIDSMVEVKSLGNLPELKGVSLYRNPINEDKKLYAGVILGICKKLESLDHTSVEEIRKKYGIDTEQENLEVEALKETNAIDFDNYDASDDDDFDVNSQPDDEIKIERPRIPIRKPSNFNHLMIFLKKKLNQSAEGN